MDATSPEALLDALYATLSRPPGGLFDWSRQRTLYLPSARLIPSLIQTGGVAEVFTVGEFIEWADGYARADGPDDMGFEERQAAVIIERFGDIAHAFSTYEMGYYGLPEVLGRGINSIQMLRRNSRWWITQVAWDDASDTQPIPERYLGGM